MQRKLAFNLLSAAEIHEIILLRKLSSAAPCGHRLRCRYQNSGGGYSVASYILSSLREERLGEKGGAFLNGKEGRVGFRKMTITDRYCKEEQNIFFLKKRIAVTTCNIVGTLYW